METFWEIINKDFVNGAVKISILRIFLIVVIFIVIHLIIRAVRFVLTRVTSRNEDFDKAKTYTVTQLLKYFLYVIAIVLVLDNIGININALLIGSAAFLAAVGLGLQPIFHDMVSGLVIFFEGILHKGDVLEIDGTVVMVEEINLRTSKVKNRDGNFIIIPNSKLTTNDVINWSHQNELTRFQINVGVAYGSDTEQVKNLLIECAQSHEMTIKHKGYEVWFHDFGDSSLNFQLFFWAVKSWESEVIKSEIRFKIDKVFREKNIKIPFPQREIHYSGSKI